MGRKLDEEAIKHLVKCDGIENYALKVWGHHLIVKPHKMIEQTKGGIIIPDIAQEIGNVGLVIDVGEGRHTPMGLDPMIYKPGQLVMFGDFGGEIIVINDTTYLKMRMEEILMTLEIFSGKNDIILDEMLENLNDYEKLMLKDFLKQRDRKIN